MKQYHSFLCAALAAAGAAACQSGRGECDYLRDGYAVLSSRVIYDLPHYPLSRVSASTLQEVERCWAQTPYGGDLQYTLELREAREAPASRYYLIFEPRGVTDVALAFLIDEHGSVVDAFEYSML